MSKLKESQGFCKYCKQAVMIQAPEDATQEQLNKIASKECSCKEADYQRKRELQLGASKEYIHNLFYDNNPLLCKAMYEAVEAIFSRKCGSAAFKTGKTTYKIDLDGDGKIRIKKTFKDEDEETF